jgi:ABC-2 type transport system ATP-binding protein
MNAIEAQHLHKAFGRGRKCQRALIDVSLQVGEGEAFGFIGANGAGKSTTIKILMDMMRPDDGETRFFGVPGTNPASRRSVGYVPENPYLYDYLTPLEVLQIGVRQHGLAVADLRSYCMEWLERFGIAAAAGRRIRTLSKGMTQRTALAHAMACQPRLLILDEPLSGLDPLGRLEVVDILKNYRRGGGTLLFTSHVLYDVENIADRFALIKAGRIEHIKTASDLFSDSEGIFEINVEADTPLEGYRNEIGRRWSVDVPRENLSAKLQEIERAAHSIISIKPQLTLEKMFYHSVEQP